MKVADTFTQYSDLTIQLLTSLQQQNRAVDDKFKEDSAQIAKNVGETPAKAVIEARNKELLNNLGKNIDLYA